MTNNIFKKSKNSFFTRRYILILVVLILFAVGSLVFIFLNPTEEYNLIFYYEDYYEGQVSPFYLLNTHDFSRREITIEEINKLDLITGDISPDGLKIVFRYVPPEPRYFKGERLPPEIGGIFEYEVFLYRSFFRKGLIGTVDKPHGTIRVKGWVAR